MQQQQNNHLSFQPTQTFQYQAYLNIQNQKLNQKTSFNYHNYHQQQNQIHNQQLISSNYLKQYMHYFSDIETQADNHIQSYLHNTHEKFKHNIVIIDHNSSLNQLVSFAAPTILISGNLFGGIIINYEIIVGNYKLKVDLLNINNNAPNQLTKIGFGSYGSIYRIKYSHNKNIVAKRLLFRFGMPIKFQQKQIRPNRMEINEYMHEYSIYKICSFYKIGPLITNQLGFDIVCFSNCLQFYMEECQRRKYIFSGIEHDLKLCLRILHKIKIIHKDVKTANIMFSYSHNRFILSDFGISHSVEEKIGFKSKTYKQGSPGFMSPQMEQLNVNKENHVDLYYNDLHGLKISILQLNKHYQMRERPKILEIKQTDQFKNIMDTMKYSIYTSIYLLKMLVKLKSNDISLEGEQLDLYMKKARIMVKQIFNIRLTQQQEITLTSLINLIENRYYEHYLENLIRIYGLSMELMYELNKLKSTEIVNKLRQRIKVSKDIYFISEQRIRKLKYIEYSSKYMFSLQHQLLYYKLQQKQLKISFRQKIIKISLDIFLAKIETGQVIDYRTTFKLIQNVMPYFCNDMKNLTQEMLLFILICNNVMYYKQHQVEIKLQTYQNLFPKCRQKLYTYLLKYYTFGQNKQTYIIKYGNKLQLIYNSNPQFYAQQYLWLLSQLALAYTKINNKFSVYYFEQLKLQTLQYINKIEQTNLYRINCYQYLAIYYYSKQEFQLSYMYYGKQLSMIKYFYGEYETRTAKCYFNIAKCLLRFNRLQQAEQYAKKALKIFSIDSHYRKSLKLQDQVKQLMCIIGLLQYKEEMMIYYYNELHQGKKIKKMELIKQDQKEDIKMKQYKNIGVVQIMKQARNNDINMNFAEKFNQYRKQYYHLHKILKESEKYKKKSSFLTQRLQMLKLNEKQICNYIEQNLKIVFNNPPFLDQYKLAFLLRFIKYYHQFNFQNIIHLINQAYIQVSQDIQHGNNLWRSIQFSQKRADLIITYRKQFNKFQLITCLLKLKKYYFQLNQYSDAIYYFKTLMSTYKNQQVNFIYDILSECYLKSNLQNHQSKAFQSILKYYKMKKEIKKEKYDQLIQLCVALNKKGITQMIKQYCKLRLEKKDKKFASLMPTNGNYYEYFKSLKYNKNLVYLKKKAKIFKLITFEQIRLEIDKIKGIVV